MLECGGGWIAHWMDRIDEFLESYGWAAAPLSLDADGVLPAPVLDQLRPGRAHDGGDGPIAGADNLIWASDFPHSDAKYPGVVDELREHNGDADPTDRAELFGANALASTGIDDPSSRVSVMSVDLVVRGGDVVDGTGAAGRTPPTSPSATDAIAEVGRVDERRATEDRRRRRCSSRPASSTSTRTTTRSCTGSRPRRRRRGTASRRCSPATAGSRSPRPSPRRSPGCCQMLSRVEGMSAEALAAGVDVRGRRLGDFLAGLDGRARRERRAPTSATPRCVATSWATTRPSAPRPATRSPRCRSSSATRMREGAVGFTSSQLDLHVAHDGRGVPSNHAAPEELVALAGRAAPSSTTGRDRVHPAHVPRGLLRRRPRR